MVIFNYLLGALLLAAGLYFLYANIRTWREAVKQKEIFLKNHPDAQTVKVNKNIVFWNGVMAVGALAVAVILTFMTNDVDDQTRFSQGAVYLGLAFFAFALWIENVEESKVIYLPEGCIYSTRYIRYKQVRNIEVGKGLFKGSILTLSDGKEEPVSRAMAKWMSEQMQDWRKNRSNRLTKANRRNQKKGKNTADKEQN